MQVTDAGVLRALPGIEAEPVRQWVAGQDGKRRPGEAQAVDETGVPLWDLKAFGHLVQYDRPTPAFITLRIASATRPAVADLELLPLVMGADR